MERGAVAWLGGGLRVLAWLMFIYAAILLTITLLFWGDWRTGVEQLRELRRQQELELLVFGSVTLGLSLAIYAVAVAVHHRFQNFRTAGASFIQLLLRDLAGFVTSILTISGSVLLLAAGLVDNIDFNETLSMAAVGGGLFSVGVLVRRWAKRKAAPTAAELLRADPRPPVLYLRAFRDDMAMRGVTFQELHQPFILGRELSEEEQLAAAVASVGPLIAIADPGSRFQNVGAAKASYADDAWQAGVQKLIAESALVLIRVSSTDFVYWEIEQAWRIAGPQKTIFLFGDLTAASDFKQRFEALTGFKVDVVSKRNTDAPGSIKLAVRVAADGDVLTAPVNPVGWWRRRFAASALPQLQAALSRLDDRVEPPPLNWSLIVFLGIWPVLLVFLALWAVVVGPV